MIKHKKKKTLSEENRFLINSILNNYKGSTDVLNTAFNMDIDLANILYQKVVTRLEDDKTPVAEDSIIDNLVGILGNLYASLYYKSLGYDVENEKVIKNKDTNKEDTKADIYFKDKQGIDNFCEVKAAFEIRGPRKRYIDESLSKQDIKDLELKNKAYEEIGKKLITQVEKLKKDNPGSIVNAVIFKDCIIDEEIIDKLEELDVNLKILMQPISMVKEEAKLIYENFISDYLTISKKESK